MDGGDSPPTALCEILASVARLLDACFPVCFSAESVAAEQRLHLKSANPEPKVNLLHARTPEKRRNYTISYRFHHGPCFHAFPSILTSECYTSRQKDLTCPPQSR
jgi:hypothetical protein